MHAHSIRTFLGAKNFSQSREFYKTLGFTENPISHNMSYFAVNDKLGFYLQDYYVRKWAENSMVFLEVDDLEQWLEKLRALNLPDKFRGVKLSDIQVNDWGSEFFLHDPAGILWHFGKFNS